MVCLLRPTILSNVITEPADVRRTLCRGTGRQAGRPWNLSWLEFFRRAVPGCSVGACNSFGNRTCARRPRISTCQFARSLRHAVDPQPCDGACMVVALLPRLEGADAGHL